MGEMMKPKPGKGRYSGKGKANNVGWGNIPWYGKKRLTQQDTIGIYNSLHPSVQNEIKQKLGSGGGSGPHDITGWFWCMVCCLMSSCCDDCTLCDRDCFDEW